MIIAAPRVMANDTIATIATPHFANVSAYFINGTNETSAPPDYGMWFTNALQVYPDFIGPIAYLLIFFIPFGMIFLSHGDIKLISILGLLTAPFIILYLGGVWVAAAFVVILLSILGLIWRLSRP
jgi:hypothetical protein